MGKIETPGKEKVKEYRAKVGAAFGDDVAQKYGERIKEMMDQKGGKLTTIGLLTEAEKKTSVFHDYFCWDDKKAANEHRLYQARKIMNSIVEVVVINHENSYQSSFFNVSGSSKDPKKFYVEVQTAIHTPCYRTELLTKIINHLKNTTQLMELFRHEK